MLTALELIIIVIAFFAFYNLIGKWFKLTEENIYKVNHI